MELIFIFGLIVSAIGMLVVSFDEMGWKLISIWSSIFTFCLGILIFLCNINDKSIIEKEIVTSRLEIRGETIVSDKPITYLLKYKTHHSWSIVDNQLIEIKVVQ